MKTLSKEYQNILNVRVSIYRFLHLIYSERLSRENFNVIKEKGDIEILLECGEGGEMLYHYFKSNMSVDLKQEEQEFNRLFVGPGPLIAPPWESVYRSKDRITHDFPALQMADLYKSFDIEFTRKYKEAEDHLSLQLEFMIYLINNSINEEWIKVRFLEGQEKLIHLHLCKWIPNFTQDVIDNTNSILYEGAAKLLNEFIEYDAAFIQEVCSVRS